MPTIAILDSDRTCLSKFAAVLEADGYKVLTFADPAWALRTMLAQPPDLAIIGLVLAKADGVGILRQMRAAKGGLPFIMVSGPDDETSEILAFRAGGDDYVRKTVPPRVLAERVKALLKRRPDQSHGAKTPAHVPMVRGDMTLDAVRHTCHWRQVPVSLTVTEFKIIQSLAIHHGAVKSRPDLMSVAYETNPYIDLRTIDGHMKRIRRKFRQCDPEFDLIETLYGMGYRLRTVEPRGRPQSPEITGLEDVRR